MSGRDDGENNRVAAAVFGRQALKPRRLRSLTNSAAHSEWSEIGVLRTDWSRTSPRLTVGYSQRKFSSEFDCGRELLWSGGCDPQVRFNGTAGENVSLAMTNVSFSAAQVSLIVSDTNPQAAAQVASGPTYTRAQTDDATQHLAAIHEGRFDDQHDVTGAGHGGHSYTNPKRERGSGGIDHPLATLPRWRFGLV